jgi:hypothetical protein
MCYLSLLHNACIATLLRFQVVLSEKSESFASFTPAESQKSRAATRGSQEQPQGMPAGMSATD